MKNIIIMSFLLLGSCSLAPDPVSSVRHYFPSTWQGYYTKISGSSSLPAKFKISNKYMSYKDGYYYDSDDFLIYHIDRIRTYSLMEDFEFYTADSYEEQSSNERYYSFTDNGNGTITVKRSKYLNYTSSVYIAIYSKSTTPR